MSVENQSRSINVNIQVRLLLQRVLHHLHLSHLHLKLHLLLSLVPLLLVHLLLLRVPLPLLHIELLLLLSGSLLERRSWGTVLPRANPGSASHCKTPKYLSFYILIFPGVGNSEISFFRERNFFSCFIILFTFPFVHIHCHWLKNNFVSVYVCVVCRNKKKY